jgi:hypothetical protein
MATSSRTSTSNKPTLKSQGAKYSTTNSKGVTTYYSSSKDAPGYNDNGSSSGKAPISQVDAMGAVIPAKMEAQTPAQIPKLTVPDVGNVVGQNNTALSSILGDTGTTYDATKGQFVTAPTQPTDNFQSLFEQATSLGNAAFNEMGTGEERLAKLEKENQLKQKQQAVNETTGQINAIVAQSQAQQLALEGQGRGQTASFVGGEQARINREAAIAALPLQAKLAAEQGALELAQNHIDKMFQVQSQDALAKYQYKSNLISSVYTFATAQEQRRLDAIKANEDRAYDMQKTNLSYQRQLASEAASYGLGGVSASILKLDPTSPTFNQDIAGLQGRVMKPVVATVPKAPDLQNFGTGEKPNWRQYNPTTGAWEEVSGISETPSNALSNAIAENKVDNINNILNSNALDSVVGPSGLARTQPGLWSAAKRFFTGAITGAGVGGGIGALAGGVGAIPGAIIGAVTTGVVNTLRGSKDELTGDRQSFIGSVEQMRSELTKEKLAQAKGQGVTFGALSDGERGLIANAATKLGTWAQYVDGDKDKPVIGYNIDEKSFKKEMDVINYFTKLDAIIQGATPESVGAVTQPDGSVWILNSDGTLSEIKRY